MILPVLVPLLFGIAMFFIKTDEFRNTLTACATLLTLLLVLMACIYPPETVTFFYLSDTVYLSFGIDGISRIFMVLFAFFWVFCTYYTQVYIKHEGKESRFFGFFLLTLSSLIALSLAQNLVTLYLCFEAMSLLSMPLVLHDGSRISRDAAMQYLGYSALGASLFLLGWFLAAAWLPNSNFVAGGMALSSAPGGILTAAFFLMVLGFGAKAGMMPLQVWLPVAHPVAPAPASALLSSLVTKGGVIAIIRVTFYVFGADFVRGTWAQAVLLLLSIVTVFTGSMLALRTKLLKKRLAYSTVSQVSYVLFGLFLLNEAGFEGAFLQIIFHAFAKGILFLAAGVIIYTLGYTKVGELKGIGKRMRTTLICFTLGSLSLIGIPPAGGFIAKWYLADGGLSLNNPLALAGVIVLLISAVLTAFYLFEIITDAFFPGRKHKPGPPVAVSKKMLVPMIVFSAVILFFGFYPNLLLGLISGVSGTLL